MSSNSVLTKPYANSSAALLLRLGLGVIFFAHGAQKVLGWFGGYGLAGSLGYFENVLGMSAPLFYLTAFTEFIGGIAITFGLLSRVFAVGYFIEMLVALFKVHLPMGFFMNWGSIAGHGEGYEFHIALLAMSLAAALLGPGAYSLDYLFVNHRAKEKKLIGEVVPAIR
ncbi:MAG: DoxX family protein [Bacteroidota bacterium]